MRCGLKSDPEVTIFKSTTPFINDCYNCLATKNDKVYKNKRMTGFWTACIVNLAILGGSIVATMGQDRNGWEVPSQFLSVQLSATGALSVVAPPVQKEAINNGMVYRVVVKQPEQVDSAVYTLFIPE